MLSAARNYYAGILLLGKECLVRAAPDADPMEVIGAKFEPVPDGEGGVDYEVSGFNTIDLGQLKARFKAFNLKWPSGDINKLQRLRNTLEHYHLDEPIESLKEAIAASFPIIIDFFELLGEDPQEHLADVWDTIIETKDAFIKIQASCVESLENLAWPGPITDLDQLACVKCGSSLIGQHEKANTEIQHAEGRCFACGETYFGETLVTMIVANSFEIDAYLAAKNGESSPIHDCPECGVTAYVQNGEADVCYWCEETVGGECVRCSTDITIDEYNPDYPDLCSYCAYQAEKIMRDD